MSGTDNKFFARMFSTILDFNKKMFSKQTGNETKEIPLKSKKKVATFLFVNKVNPLV